MAQQSTNYLFKLAARVQKGKDLEKYTKDFTAYDRVIF